MFDEKVFLWALTTRPEDAKKCLTTFSPSWLKDARYIPVCKEIYSFTKEFGTPPSFQTLHKIFQDKEPEAYKLRYSHILKELENQDPPDLSTILYTLNKVRDVSITQSFNFMATGPEFIRLTSENRGTEMVKEVYKWLTQFYGVDDDESMNIKDAIDKLIQNSSLYKKERMPTGISVIDDWTGGGLRDRMLGILIAPTGHGKSAVLLNMAYHMALVEDLKVWFVTNELTLDEQAERFLSRLQNMDLNLIQDRPKLALGGIEAFWSKKLHEKLTITSVNREVSTLDLESTLLKEVQMNGWKPDVLILDYMERMKPNDTGYDRSKEWNWIGAVSRDLLKFSKKHRILTWTAAQTNRGGMNAAAITMDMTQGSIKHLQEAAAVIGMLQTRADESEDIKVMTFFPLKMRHSKNTGEPVTLYVDLSRMLITDKIKVQETPQVQRSVQLTENTGQIKQFNGKFNSKRRKKES